MNCASLRRVPMRYMPIRCTPIRYVHVRHISKMHAHEVHAREIQACEVYAHEIHAHKTTIVIAVQMVQRRSQAGGSRIVPPADKPPNCGFQNHLDVTSVDLILLGRRLFLPDDSSFCGARSVPRLTPLKNDIISLAPLFPFRQKLISFFDCTIFLPHATTLVAQRPQKECHVVCSLPSDV
jgi:hypothetical protein